MRKNVKCEYGIEIVSRELKELLDEHEEFSYQREFLYKNGHSTDYMILKNRSPFIALEVKADLANLRQYNNGKMQLKDSLYEYYLQYGILTDGKEYKLFNLLSQNEIFESQDLRTIFEYVCRNVTPTPEDIENCKTKIREILRLLCPRYKKHVKDFQFLIKDNVVSLSENDELTLFNQIVPEISQNTHISRYASIYTLFATIENNTYRLNASEGMNDREECDFLWNRINEHYDKNDKYRPNRALEPVYIMSCVSAEKKDDLTMWRLYGDDAKGVCMTFENKKLPNGFYLRKVIYDDKQVMNLCKLVNVVKEYGYRFVFNYWELWGAFFKSEDYKVENEVRLVYIESLASWKPKNTKKWVLTNSNHMPNKYVEFENSPSTLFPLRLRDVLIGPECLENDVVCEQFDKMMKESTGFQDVVTDFSRKGSYRASR